MNGRDRELQELTENMIWTVHQIESLMMHLRNVEAAMVILGVNTDAVAKVKLRLVAA
jgi:hypothetical protein